MVIYHRFFGPSGPGSTLAGMSSRVRSEFGSLGERVAATAAGVERSGRGLPRHVWIDGIAGLLLAWDSRADGWWGRCVVVDDRDQACELWVRADRMKPA